MNNNNTKIILDLCSGSGSWSKPYKEAIDINGNLMYDVRLITLPDTDVMTYIPPNNVYGILATPPCTEFNIAKMKIVNACTDIIRQCNPVFWALENPDGNLSQFLGNPSFTFQPWWYGDMWTKRTLLWGFFNIPIRTNYDYTPLKGGYKGRQKDSAFRAITPPGFANAFFESNRYYFNIKED